MAEESTWSELPRRAADAALPHPGPTTYSDIDRAAAFYVWFACSPRTFTAASGILGIERETLSRWHDQDNWPERAKSYQDSAANSLDTVARAIIRPMFPEAILVMREIMFDKTANANARVKAAQFLAGVNGMVPPKPATLTVTQHQDGSSSVTLRADALASLTDDELAAMRAGAPLPARLLPGLPDPE